MVLLIDASNIQTGGGLTHLSEILRHVDPWNYGFEKVIVCSNRRTLDRIEDREWLQKYNHPYLERSYFFRAIWANFILRKVIQKHQGFLFLVGSIKPLFTKSYVTICQNLLPLEYKELFRFGVSKSTEDMLDKPLKGFFTFYSET